MKIIFCSSFFKNTKEVIKKSKIAPSIATHKLNLNLVKGFYEHIGEDLIVINNEDCASFPSSKFFVVNIKKYFKENILIETIYKINLPIAKYFFEYLGYCRKIKKVIKKYPNERIFILSYGRYFPNVLAVNHMKKKFSNRIFTCMYIADLSGKQACTTAEYHPLRTKLANYVVEKGVTLSKQFDSFIMISQYIANFLGVAEKPNVTIEGMIDPQNIIKPQYIEKNIVLYSGILSAQYGVDLLIEAVKSIGDIVELHLYGDGPLKEKLLKMNVPNVKFFGFVPNDELLRKQAEAKILINPRQNIEDFTKYSMPSKNLEYLAAGKPVICYKLDGIPDEYDSYFNYIEGNKIDDIKKAIENILKLNSKELFLIGKRNQEFVLKNKSIYSQVSKIMEMFLNNQIYI